MKIFTLILSFYVMLLTGVSCPDAFESSESEYITAEAFEAGDADCQGDLCSPFCSCTCCVGFDKPQNLRVTSVHAEAISADIPYKERDYNSERYPLFQPPRA